MSVVLLGDSVMGLCDWFQRDVVGYSKNFVIVTWRY